MGGTIVSSVDFSGARGLETVVHLSPSTVDPSTLLRTVRGYGDRLPGEVRSFFADAGIPVQFLDVLHAVASKVVYYRCFIAHGDPDAAFAEKLYRTLKEMGVTCWLHRLDATPGERTWKEIAEQLRDAEKVIVICSGNSLVRDGLQKELERLIDEYPEKIVPVSLDDLWKHPGFRVIRGVKDLKLFLLEKNHADFQKHDYERALKDLLRGITARPVAED